TSAARAESCRDLARPMVLRRRLRVKGTSSWPPQLRSKRSSEATQIVTTRASTRLAMRVPVEADAVGWATASPGARMTDQTPHEGDLILYRTADDAVRVEVLYESETFWLDQRRIAELFGVEIPTISYHLKEVYASGELTRDATLRRVRRVQREG